MLVLYLYMPLVSEHVVFQNHINVKDVSKRVGFGAVLTALLHSQAQRPQLVCVYLGAFPVNLVVIEVKSTCCLDKLQRRY
jgi:hypothetical protein